MASLPKVGEPYDNVSAMSTITAELQFSIAVGGAVR